MKGRPADPGTTTRAGTVKEGSDTGSALPYPLRVSRLRNLALSRLPRKFFSIPSLAFVLLPALTLAGASCTIQPEPYKETRFMMGTLVDLVLYADHKSAADAARKAFEGMVRIEALAHHSDEGGPVNRISRGEGADVEGELRRILDAAMEVSRATSGAFDPTVGAVVHLWGFGREDPTLPDPEEIARALRRPGWEQVPDGNCCPEGLDFWFDLGGVAKGFAVDEAVKLLKRSGIRAGIVNAGGDLRSFGDRPGRNGGNWRIGVQDPADPQELAGVLQVKEAAVATSGDYQRYFQQDGVTYHHILDPATGYPARSGIRGTTVVADNCATADALATAVFVLGPDKGLTLIEEWEGAEAVLITESGEMLTTSGIGEGGILFEER